MNLRDNGTDVLDLSSNEFLFKLCSIAVDAGVGAVRLRREGLVTEYKEDNSPVTNADKKANAIICDGLRALTPDIPIISEENVEDWPSIDALKTGYYWLIDPIDGTKSFMADGNEFTVNIALIKDMRPVLGVIDVPRLGGGVTYMGVCDSESKRAMKQLHDGEIQIITTRRMIAGEDIRVVMSKRAYKGDDTLPEGVAEPDFMSSSYKLCMVADGAYDAVAGFGPTSEWDIAAGHAIVKAAGGDVIGAMGGVFDYNKPIQEGRPRYENPSFLVYGDENIERRLIAFAERSKAKKLSA